MKTGIKILTAALLAFAISGAASAEEVRIGVAPDPNPPLSVKSPSGKMEGYEIDLLDSVCTAAGLDCKLVELSWDGLLAALQEKKIDVVWSSLSITDARKEKFLFTDPLYASRPIMLARKDDPTEIQFCTKGSLDGKQFGAAAGSMLLKFAENCFGPGLVIKTYPTPDGMFSDLALGRIDYVAGSRLGLVDFLASADGGDFEIRATFPDDPSLGNLIGGALRLEDTATKEKLDTGLRKVMENGEYQTIMKKYFDFDVTP